MRNIIRLIEKKKIYAPTKTKTHTRKHCMYILCTVFIAYYYLRLLLIFPDRFGRGIRLKKRLYIKIYTTGPDVSVVRKQSQPTRNKISVMNINRQPSACIPGGCRATRAATHVYGAIEIIFFFAR